MSDARADFQEMTYDTVLRDVGSSNLNDTRCYVCGQPADRVDFGRPGSRYALASCEDCRKQGKA